MRSEQADQKASRSRIDFRLIFAMLESMNGAEFQVDEQGTVQMLQDAPGASLLLDPNRRIWLPWGRRPLEPGDWPAGGEAAWSAIYRPTWQRWAPKRVLLRPVRWRASNGRWSDLRPGFAILALSLQKAPGTPLYVVVLDGGAPKLMPRIREREEAMTLQRRAAEAAQEAQDEAEYLRARELQETFLVEVEHLAGRHSRDEVKSWDKARAQRWWVEEVAREFPRYSGLFEHFWSLNDTLRWIGPHRF